MQEEWFFFCCFTRIYTIKKTPAANAGVLRVTRLWFEIYNLISVAALMITSATAFGCEMKTT